jgi:protein-disulfide isomerase
VSERKHGSLRPSVNGDDHVAGPADAPVTLVEYGDFECPYCFQAHPIIRMLQERLGAKLRFVFRNFPLTEIHPHALQAAEAAESVAASSGMDAYWKMHDAIFDHQQDSPDALDVAHLVQYAAAAGADPDRVKTDLDHSTFEDKVRSDFMSGVRSGVNGTPTFFINGARFEGDWTKMRELREALEAAAGEAASAL